MFDRATWTYYLSTIKVLASGSFTAAALILYTFDASHGERAAACAMLTAAVLLMESLPMREPRNVKLAQLSRFAPRLCGAVLAFLTALNWTLHEAEGEPAPFLFFIVAVFVGAIGVVGASFVSSLTTFAPRQSGETSGFTGETCIVPGDYMGMCPSHKPVSLHLDRGDRFPTCVGHSIVWLRLYK